jgi:hypothetical protein
MKSRAEMLGMLVDARSLPMPRNRVRMMKEKMSLSATRGPKKSGER